MGSAAISGARIAIAIMASKVKTPIASVGFRRMKYSKPFEGAATAGEGSAASVIGQYRIRGSRTVYVRSTIRLITT